MNVILFPLIFLFPGTIAGTAAETFLPLKQVPTTQAAYTRTAPKIDGTWDATEWASARPILFPPASRTPAEVRFLWNESGLFVAFRGHDSSPAWKHFRMGEPLYQEDVFEFFVDPAGDHRQFYEIQINPAGNIYIRNNLLTAPLRLTKQGRIEQDYVESELWRYGLSVPEGFLYATAVDAEKKSWSAEMFLPASFINRRKRAAPLQPGTWRINLAQCDWDLPYGAANRRVEFLYWSPVLPGHPHISPTLMGRLQLIKP